MNVQGNQSPAKLSKKNIRELIGIGIDGKKIHILSTEKEETKQKM